MRIRNNTKTMRTLELAILCLILCCGCCPSHSKRVCFGKSCVLAEVADTPAKRQNGLMFRDSLPLNKGMLFVFEKEGEYGFWMKNMHFPLDLLWVDSAKRVVFIYQNALPCKDVCKTLVPRAAARFVVEVNAGFVARNHVQIGDSVSF